MSYPTNNQGERVNPNLPGSYQPVMNQDNFNAPAHQLSTKQQEQVAELAEASSGHIHNTSLGQSGGNSGGFGSGSLGNTNNTNLADTLGSTGGQRGGHLGQYEYTENQLDEPLDKVGRGSDSGNTGRSGGLSGSGDGTRQAAGMGVGGGLAATAASQGLGNQRQERSIEDQRLGGLIGDDPSYGGATSGHTGRGSNMDEAIQDASGRGGHSSGAGGYGAGAAAVGTGAGLGAAGAGSQHGGSSGLSSGTGAASGDHGAGAGDRGMLAQPQYETGLTNELERRAQAAGTHAGGFGTKGNE